MRKRKQLANSLALTAEIDALGARQAQVQLAVRGVKNSMCAALEKEQLSSVSKGFDFKSISTLPQSNACLEMLQGLAEVEFDECARNDKQFNFASLASEQAMSVSYEMLEDMIDSSQSRVGWLSLLDGELSSSVL